MLLFYARGQATDYHRHINNKLPFVETIYSTSGVIDSAVYYAELAYNIRRRKVRSGEISMKDATNMLQERVGKLWQNPNKTTCII